MHKVKIQSIDNVTHDVKRFKVEKPEGYAFTPGQATDIAIDKEGWKDKLHPFTFTSLNEEENLEFTIKIYSLNKHPTHKGMTQQLGELSVGDSLLIDDPWGTIEYKGAGVFIAGGAGLTPFIAIFRQLKKEGKVKTNTLMFSNKTQKDVIMEGQLRKMFEPDTLHLILTQESAEGYERGRINNQYLMKKITDFSQHFYVCGPKAMVNEINKTLENLGAKSTSLVFEE